MERQLGEINERLIKLETAQEFRFQHLQWHLAQIHARLSAPPTNGNGASRGAPYISHWIKVPTALLLPLLVFLLTLAITGDWHRAFTSAAGRGNG